MSDTTASDAPGYDDPQVIDAIAAWMPSTRWYPLKGQQADVTLERAFDLGDTAILLLRAGDTLLQVPVAWRDEPGERPIAALRGRWLVDACHDADAVRALIDAASGALEVEGLSGQALSGQALSGPTLSGQALSGQRLSGQALSGEASGGERPTAPADAGSIRVIAGEQSNTSIIGGGEQPWIAKVFRVVSPGDNPDVVVTGALTRAGCEPVPSLLAALGASWPAGEAFVTGHLMAVSSFVAGGEDGWELFRQHAAATLRGEERALPDAAALGAAVARVHIDLADALGTAESTEADTLRFITGLEQRLAWARQEAAGVLADLDEQLSAAAERLREVRRIGALQQIHGDLHLGQVLRASDGSWAIIDFEGEPLRPLHERMVREPRLRNVVVMLRSFDYAAGSALQEQPGADPAIAGDWVSLRRAEFLGGYADALGPVDEHDPVFVALLLDKALYEVVYELGNRPGWVSIPLAAVRSLVA